MRITLRHDPFSTYVNRPHGEGGRGCPGGGGTKKKIDWETAKERATETVSWSEPVAEVEVQTEPEEKEEESSTSSGVSGSSGAEWNGAIVDTWE